MQSRMGARNKDAAWNTFAQVENSGGAAGAAALAFCSCFSLGLMLRDRTTVPISRTSQDWRPSRSKTANAAVGRRKRRR